MDHQSENEKTPSANWNVSCEVYKQIAFQLYPFNHKLNSNNMSSQAYEITDEELIELNSDYLLFVKYEIDQLKLTREKFKASRRERSQEYCRVHAEKLATLETIEIMKRRVDQLSQKETMCRLFIKSASNEIAETNRKLKSLERELEVQKEKKLEDAQDKDAPPVDEKTTTISLADEDRGLNDIKKDIILFHDLNRKFNDAVKDDPELSALLGLDEEEKPEEFTYTSIKIKKP